VAIVPFPLQKNSPNTGLLFARAKENRTAIAGLMRGRNGIMNIGSKSTSAWPISDTAVVDAMLAADKRPRIVGKVTVAEAWAAIGKRPAATPVPGLAAAQPAIGAKSSSHTTGAPESIDASLCHKPSRFGALAPLPGENGRAYCALIQYAGLNPAPNTAEFCRDFGFSRRTVTGWRKDYRWEERIQAYFAAEALPTISAGRAAAATAKEAAAALEFDLRARSVELASAALSLWLQNADEPPNLSAVVRALEFAGKLNPGPSASSPDPGERANAEFLARIEKIYGAAARCSQQLTSGKSENVSGSEQNRAEVSKNPASNAVAAETVAHPTAHMRAEKIQTAQS
jgi:hypothetical protein